MPLFFVRLLKRSERAMTPRHLYEIRQYLERPNIPRNGTFYFLSEPIQLRTTVMGVDVTSGTGTLTRKRISRISRTSDHRTGTD